MAAGAGGDDGEGTFGGGEGELTLLGDQMSGLPPLVLVIASIAWSAAAVGLIGHLAAGQSGRRVRRGSAGGIRRAGRRLSRLPARSRLQWNVNHGPGKRCPDLAFGGSSEDWPFTRTMTRSD